MKTGRELRSMLEAIDHRGYPAYKQTKGSYRFPDYILHIDHVQGDPFASPSHLTVEVAGPRAGFPAAFYNMKHRRIALQDDLTRRFHRAAEKYDRVAKGSGKSGAFVTCAPGQEVLERSACRVDPGSGDIFFRFEAGFPANGRSINSAELIRMLFEFLPVCVREALIFKGDHLLAIQEVIRLSDDQDYLRKQLKERGLAAFVADGSILPRATGISSLPMKNARPFRSPESLRVTMELPHRGKLTGMGLKEGITLIVGGGYHGKSTLLRALELGVYNHIAGDGREYVVTDETAVKIRSEDGRSVHGTDISLFIRDLPDGRDTVRFSTEDASGSTSQAANVAEAVEGRSRLLLIDEDTCATNFMIRDQLMQQVIHRDQEPITPFIERIGFLREKAGISTILVAGSFGAFFHIADTIIQMDRYTPLDITERAREAARAFPLPEKTGSDTGADPRLPVFERRPLPIRKLDFSGRIKQKTLGLDGFMINHDTVELRYLEQIVDSGQNAALSRALLHAASNLFDGKRTLRECVDILSEMLDKGGPDALFRNSSYTAAGLTLPRSQEIFACLNRCRFLNFR